MRQNLLMTLILTTVSTAVALTACGTAPRASEVASLSSAQAPAPFPAPTEPLFLSTDCSPHSLNITLSFSAEGLQTLESISSYQRKTAKLNYEMKTITNIESYDGYDGAHSTQALLQPHSDAYAAALSGLARDVQKVKDGNVCFPAHAELAPVLEYLGSLAE